MKKLFFILIIVNIFYFDAKISLAQTISTKSQFNETFRPQFHFSPSHGWMNDPNGLVYLKGEYHLFYQYYPKDIKWGPMHWGHAVSTDLISWNHLPIALFPDSLGLIFSGSVVVDKNNTSGFFPATQNGMVAIFTHDSPKGEKQSIAYSYDLGRTWTKHSSNPVIANFGIHDFRDPKVFWYDPEKKWVMVVSLAKNQKLQFYESKNLRNWKLTGEFGPEGWHKENNLWECPDLFEIKTEDGKTKKWVLLMSVSEGFQTGSAMQYFVGDFDGKKFSNESSKEIVKWVDEGKDLYAGVTFNNISDKDGRTLMVGWLNNWQYADKVPTKRWRGALSFVNELKLSKTTDKYIIKREAVDEIKKLRKSNFNKSEISINDLNEAIKKNKVGGKLLEINIKAEIIKDDFGIKFKNKEGQECIIKYEVNSKQLTFDRSKSGNVSFDKNFAVVYSVPLTLNNNQLQLHIFIDNASIEVFVNQGEKVLTNQVFPDCFYNEILFFGNEKNIIHSFDMWNLEAMKFENDK